MSSEHLNGKSPVLFAQTDLSRMDASANTQADTSLQAIGRICNVVATCSTALADAIEQNLLKERKNQIGQTITTMEGNLTILISVHGHLLRSSLPSAEQETRQSHVVPRELPIFQWHVNKWDTTQKVYSSIEECLDKFENVLHLYSLDLNVDWHHLLPIVLSREQHFWYDNYLCSSPELPWSFACDAFICVYSINDLECQIQLTHELMLMRMRAIESVTDNMQTTIAYTATLLPELARQVSLLQVNMPREKRDTIHKMASLARLIYNTVSHTPTHPSSAHSSGFSCETTPSCECSSSKKCLLHGKNNYDTEDCHILKTALATKGGNQMEKTPHINKYFFGFCVWLFLEICPHFAICSAHAVTSDNTPLEASSSEDDQFMVIDFEQCSPYTGATISSVNTKLCSKFGWSIIPCKGKIVLATSNAIAHRLEVTKPIKVFYNNKHITHSFEVLDLAENIDVSIGTDLMPSLGIHLLGLAESWYGSNTPQTPTPIAEIEKPNNSPARTPTEHSQFMKALLPFIKANEDIPITLFCIVKESIVQLPTPPDEFGNLTGKRPCLDLRAINTLLSDDRFPLPLISELFHRCGISGTKQ
ncbi:hypothetical protein PHYBLDRAFT_146376 [Phycomyces blakesleeanus NRRL 1555(-)]|uniref:Uncharacterized protein n=1 Tax=Phycomyces blakesleeanus (strain ATCC 8743b / DSM 1359 / FGSC 10004 / NBRC 33097 / NRRL 1555) TaxID=763407 RepID=A0A162U7T0_PHYB8|nr:hypothetical protein PHYBLDRAFT_146376 [Phycomyces blakesleeanus NRRL 1555(-)]OAD73063.1 hypothetical protein PHYBLDRAFT_146376 [Phycomyces blakesleeanus NRRL 1555(-)]|eukprot:XP_018291103.1 hypothetical protein PHYBLDRAFT_146376 [Phycomyces blakesleeanus NRRL 1555(-)]